MTQRSLETPATAPRLRRDAVAGFMLCDPAYFGVEYEINPYMHLEIQADRDAAIAAWNAYRERLTALGAEVVVQPAVPGYPDLVFTNNAGMVWGDKVMVARFRHPERAGEADHDAAFFAELGYEVIILPDDVESFEGAADAVPFRDRVVCGHGPRSDPRVIPHVEKLTGLPALSVPLVDERFYHLDLAFCKLDEQTAMIVPDATTPEAVKQLVELVPQPVMLTEQDALSFCANSSVVGKTVFMHHVPERVRDELAALGFEAVEHPMPEFLKAGGSLGCMTLQVY